MIGKGIPAQCRFGEVQFAAAVFPRFRNVQSLFHDVGLTGTQCRIRPAKTCGALIFDRSDITAAVHVQQAIGRRQRAGSTQAFFRLVVCDLRCVRLCRLIRWHQQPVILFPRFFQNLRHVRLRRRRKLSPRQTADDTQQRNHSTPPVRPFFPHIFLLPFRQCVRNFVYDIINYSTFRQRCQRQYRTKIVRQMRRQIFRQMKQKAE